jgi:hypothetical protein
MNQTRTILGLLIMIFFAIPALFGIIWAVGLTQAVVSQKMLSELPQEIIAEIPNLVDGVLLAAKDENIDMHPDGRRNRTEQLAAKRTFGNPEHGRRYIERQNRSQECLA